MAQIFQFLLRNLNIKSQNSKKKMIIPNARSTREESSEQNTEFSYEFDFARRRGKYLSCLMPFAS